MNIIEWNKDDKAEVVNFLDNAMIAESLSNALHNDLSIELRESIRTDDAINVCKMKLMGEYHGILVKDNQEYLEDAEIYLLTWDGEASDGGEMTRIDYFTLQKIAKGTLFQN